MCGIASYFARESVIDFKYLDILFSYSEKRGTDGFGIVITRKDKLHTRIYTESYSKVKNEVKQFVQDNLKIGDLLMAISRAQPETESKSTITNMQPIINSDCVLVHNGAISNRIHNQLKDWANISQEYQFNTQIDSESIIASYVRHNRNIKEAMEFVSGGVAALMYDSRKDILYMINDFKPIAQGYIKGYGYILASDNNAIGEIIQDITACTRDGVCLWEKYYHHYLGGGRVKELDLDSGFVSNIKYSPRYITQNWDSNFTKPNDEELCLVACSGGLDSSLTLAMLKLAEYKNIIACHFNYGSRASAAEQIAITKVCEYLNIPLKIFDLSGIYKTIDSRDMLTDKNAPITTGTSDGVKSVQAWVPGRNMMFMNCMATFAESEVMKYNYKDVYFLGGFLNLSEAGVYGDNSEYFMSSTLEMFKYGTLIGNRIKPNYGLCDLMKSDQFELVKAFGLFDMYKSTISCDRAIVDDNGIPRNCKHNGKPACGSGLLSYWAASMVGMNDLELREFYEISEEYTAHIPGHMKESSKVEKDIYAIIDRIHFPKDKLGILKAKIKKEPLNESKLC